MQKRLSLHIGLLLVGILIFAACTGGNNNANLNAEQNADKSQSITVDHAKNFTLTEVEQGVQMLTIADSESKKNTKYEYLLVNKGCTPSDSALASAKERGATVLQLPVERCICMTSLQLSNFIAIGATDHVTGISSTRHLFDENMKAQLADGRTQQIGIEGNFDAEMVMAVDPQLILISPSKRGGFEVLTESGVPVMPHLGYQELTPLGQAEWVKLIGLLTGKAAEATAYFGKVETEYARLCQLVNDAEAAQPDATRPTIMSGDMKGGGWYATGGRSFLAQVFRDAGADYFMKDDDNTGGVNIDFETVYAQGADADYWRISNSFDGLFSYDALGDEDDRFRDFRSFRDHHVIYCNMSQVPFYESFPIHPDWLLADFISIFHPELLPEHTPHYYNLMK